MVRISHVIFDVDGLILDTESVYTEFISSFLERYNIKFEYSLKRKMMGRKPHEAAKVLLNELSIPLSVQEYLDEQSKYLTMDRWHSVQCLPGAERLIHHLASHKIPIAAASGCCSHELENKMKNHQELFSYFSHAVTSGDDSTIKHGKPMPDIFYAAANRFTRQPSSMDNVLVFEDAPAGVKGALAAGMYVVWVPDPREPVDAFLGSITESEATRVTKLNSLLDFKPEYFNLPPFIDSPLIDVTNT